MLSDDTTADALEADLLRYYGVDLLDFYRQSLTLRRLCILVTHLPGDAAVWRTVYPDDGWSRTDVLLLAVERRITTLWATVAAALGAQVDDEAVAVPVDLPDTDKQDEPTVRPLREIASMMRS